MAAVILVILGLSYWNFSQRVFPETKNIMINEPTMGIIEKTWIYPVDEFEKRITKKTFGMYITPKNSPVAPERFAGYHTGVDVEYEDISTDVPIKAIADGEVVVSRFASGYGGVTVVKHGDLYAIYGHLRLSSMLKTGTKVTMGEQIGLLGIGYSAETDGERRHLHFGVCKINSIKGYVNSKAELEKYWFDPKTLWI